VVPGNDIDKRLEPNILKRSKHQQDKTCTIMTTNYRIQKKNIIQLKVMIEGNKDEGFIHLHNLLKEGIV
jgi:hypothetical protein